MLQLFNPLKIKTMAILNRGFDQVNLRGSVGAVTYRRVDGVTLASQKVPMKSTARRTRAVMLQRMKWANLVALWKSLNVRGWHPSFPHETFGVTDFQAFMSANLKTAGIYIDKGSQRAGVTIAAPTKITEGTLVPIDIEFNNDVPETDIAVGTLNLGGSTTLKAFSDAVIANNSDWRNGDKLTFIVMRNVTADPNAPTVKVDMLQVQLDTSADAQTIILGDVIDVTLFGVVDGCIGWSGPVMGAVAAVHSRNNGDGTTDVSRQFLVCNNSTLITRYTGNVAFEKASVSYGGFAEEEYLTPIIGTEEATTIVP